MSADASAILVAFAVVAGLIATLASCAVLGISAYSAHTVVRPRRDWQPVDWQAPPTTLESVRFENAAGDVLHGWYAPPTRNNGPVVLVCHGFGTNRREGQDVMRWLTAAGYGALLFDFQAHGESGGRYTTVGLREVDDALAAVRYVQLREGPMVWILGFGFSMGASVLIIAAAQCPEIRALFLDSPFATLRRAISRSFRVFFHLPPPIFTRPTVWFAERLTQGRVGEVEPIRAIASLAPRPVFIVQGTEDSIVDPEDSLLLYAEAREPKSLWRIDGAGHVAARMVFPDEYRTRVLAFFADACEPLDSGSNAVNSELLVSDHLRVGQLAAAHVDQHSE